MPTTHSSACCYTLQEYFAAEQASSVRHEYVAGRLTCLTGTSTTHNLLTQNLSMALRTAGRGTGCRVFNTSVRLVAQENECYTYPDVLVSCDPADRQDLYQVRQPALVAEIATADYDRTEKFKHYQQIPSLRHYLLLSQVSWTVEWFRRDEAGQWIYTVLHDPAAVLEIPDLNLRLPLAELYEDTDVAPLRPQPQPDPGQPA